jgi:nitrogen fixation NifU-like protein
MEFWVTIEDGCVRRVWFTTDGCGPSLACGSMATTMCRGRQVGEAMEIAQADILQALGGLPAGSEHCALLAADTLRAACENVGTENAQAPAIVLRRRAP